MKGWEPLGGYVDERHFQKLDEFVAELIRWNKAIRLVGPKDVAGVRLQVIDAILPLLVVEPSFPLIDIGSGAGLPAIPLAIIHSGQEIHCLEPRGKRVSFLRHAARHLGLGQVSVTQDRATSEEAPGGLGGRFATATARAVANIPTLLGWALPLLAEGGEVLLGRGGGEPPPQVEGWDLKDLVEYQGPKGVGRRFVVRYKRNP